MIYCLNPNQRCDMLNLIPFLTSESQDISHFEQTDDVDMVEIEDLRQSYEIAR